MKAGNNQLPLCCGWIDYSIVLDILIYMLSIDDALLLNVTNIQYITNYFPFFQITHTSSAYSPHIHQYYPLSNPPLPAWV